MKNVADDLLAVGFFDALKEKALEARDLDAVVVLMDGAGKIGFKSMCRSKQRLLIMLASALEHIAYEVPEDEATDGEKRNAP